ncbi:hypothetical protein J4460_01515 [Candidatus Woesearchaeota archaeon]|nr:MAG: hypothetical protein QS99_C0001G0118 [archaeon GW2011_AR4]MBS3129329.1 hypothetical protein [Candidatus Woesearchaeota archaeon]HIH38632.1 hypothetical protein [Candidatus Woesearchaeota archaeon]HIH49429.1 hypothetical protein [Candidatus Woesearchaeota archaeon]HIJ02836.1 hypothetical protein [Candidatus Woesearchaeota archaeon]
MKKIAGYIFIALLIAGISSAVEENHAEIFAQAKQLIDARTSCENLSDDQLEMIGEYYMEQMHPGDAHERMDEMMGGEGSETLRIMHIRMAKALYCGESQMMGSGMMGMMMNGMMGSGMMASGGNNMMNTNYGYGGMMNNGGMMGSGGMMNGYGWFGWSFVWLLYVALAAFIFGIIFWWTYKLIIKENGKKPKKR